MRTNVLLVRLQRKSSISTCTVSLASRNRTPVHLHGNKLRGMERDPTGARPHLTLSVRQSPRSGINDIYCFKLCSWQISVCTCDRQQELFCKLCDWKQGMCLCKGKEGQFSYREGRKKRLFVTGKKETVRTL